MRLWMTAVLAAAGCFSAQAGVITTYGSSALFLADLNGTPVVEEFTNNAHFPISTGILNSSTNLPGIGIVPGMIQPGVTYSTPIGESFFFNIDAGGGFTGGFLDGFWGGDANRQLTVAFDSPAWGFGFDTNYLMGGDFDITITFAGGGSYTNNFAVSPSLTFFGFMSSQKDIASAVIGGNGNGSFAFALDNFTFDGSRGGQVIVPEPGSMALLAAGLGLVAAWRRRARQ